VRIFLSWWPIGSDLRADRICGEVVGLGWPMLTVRSEIGPSTKSHPEILQRSRPLGQSAERFASWHFRTSGAGESAGHRGGVPCQGVPYLRVRSNSGDNNRDDADAQNRNRGFHENVRAGRHVH